MQLPYSKFYCGTAFQQNNLIRITIYAKDVAQKLIVELKLYIDGDEIFLKCPDFCLL
jgi:hypothetical protein